MENLLNCVDEVMMQLNDTSAEKEYLTEILKDLKENEENLRKSKEAMQNDLTSLEKQVKRQNEEQGEKSVVTPKEKEIHLQVERAKQHRQDAGLELEKYVTDMQQCQEQLSKLSVDRENICDKNSTQLEKIKYDIDLYTHITGIRWQYDCEADDIKGYISKHGFLKPFTLNSRKNSGFFVANYLWDLMEES
ncbi:Hypothetical predicted protein [Octopus vulgaris]|uniref:Kinetochore protein Spc24 n=1 Tax=Octopus vulgaris TaxID=6645 RepID=A0AA36AYV2_OCTVU|nr:Hypothetical predicted protein [Octopus vulgaris]